MNEGFQIRRLLSLIHVNVKESLSQVFSQAGGKRGGSKRAARIRGGLLLLVIVLACLPLAFLLASGVSETTRLLLAAQLEPIMVSVILVIGMLIIFVPSFVLVPTSYYFSEDLELYMTMPLRPSEILAAKFLSVTIQQYAIALLFVIPLTVGYLQVAFSVRALFGWLISILFLPIFPVLFVSLLTWLLMLIAPVLRNKNRMAMVTGIFSIAVAIGVNMILQSGPNGDPSKMLQDIVLNGEGIFQTAAMVFPPLRGAQLMIAGNGAGSFALGLVLVVGINVLLFLVYLFLMEKSYFRVILSMNAGGTKRAELNAGARAGAVSRSGSAFGSLAQREWKTLFRTPAYFLNSVLGAFILPIMLIFGLFVGLSRAEVSWSELLPLLRNGYPQVVEIVGGEIPLGLAVGWLLGIFSGAISGTSITAYSRDAKHLGVLAAMPISPLQLALAKMMPGLVLGLLCPVLLMIGAGVLLGGQPLLLVSILIGSILSTYLTNCLDLILDAMRPRLQWSNEQQAIKGNVNVFFGQIIHFALFGAILFLGIQLSDYFVMYTYIVMGVTLLLSLFATLFLARRAERLLSRMNA